MRQHLSISKEHPSDRIHVEINGHLRSINNEKTLRRRSQCRSRYSNSFLMFDLRNEIVEIMTALHEINVDKGIGSQPIHVFPICLRVEDNVRFHSK